MIALRHVVVATDFGEAAAQALQIGKDTARALGARLHLIHVVDDVAAKLAAIQAYSPALEQTQLEMERDAEEQLKALVTDEERAALQVETVVVTALGPARAILDYAEDVTADLIIVGTHGRGAIGHLLLGSVAERVVRAAHCPVMTIRAPAPPQAPGRAAGAEESSTAARGRSGARPTVTT